MPTEISDNVYIRAGETMRIEITVRNTDGSLMNLTGCAAKIGISLAGALSIRDCTIIGSKVIAILTDEETSTLDGNYRYEIVLETAEGEKKSLAYGILVITPSLIDDIYGTETFPPVIPE